MKKSNLLIAVLAVLTSASMAKAGEVQVDFDGINVPQSINDALTPFYQYIPDSTPFPEPSPAIDPLVPCSMVGYYDENLVWIDCDTFQEHIPHYLIPVIAGTQSGPSEELIPMIEPWQIRGGDGLCMEKVSGPMYSMVECNGPAWDVLMAGPARQSVSRAASANLQKRIREILLGYCDAYPEFTHAVLPVLNKKDSGVVIYNGAVYVVGGNSLVRLGQPGGRPAAGNALKVSAGQAGPAAGSRLLSSRRDPEAGGRTTPGQKA